MTGCLDVWSLVPSCILLLQESTDVDRLVGRVGQPHELGLLARLSDYELPKGPRSAAPASPIIMQLPV